VCDQMAFMGTKKPPGGLCRRWWLSC